MTRQIILLLPLLSIIIKATSQDGIPGQVKASFVQVRDANTGNKKPVKRPCLLWLPASYSYKNNSPFYPLMVFLHSSKESGPANGTSINILKKNGPFYFLQNKKWKGTAGYSGDCGQKEFIVFSMQANTGSGIDVRELDYAIAQLLLRFRIDETRIIFTGINEGAASIIYYVLDSMCNNQPRLIAPMSVPASFDPRGLAIAAKKGIKLWAFTFDKDAKAGINFMSTTSALVNNFNKAVSNSAKLTITPGINCCWNKYYDPAFRETDNDSAGTLLNIYEWIMKNISWGNASPPLYTCDEYVATPYKFAGYITTGRQTKKEAAAASCTIPVYTTNGKIVSGSTIYLQKSGETITGNNLHYGFSTSKLRATTSNRHLTIDTGGKVTLFEQRGFSK